MISPGHQFADDSPKSNPWLEDALGFAKFAERLAEALVAQEAPAGYVFGLHGEWGSGKSTVLNFVRCHLKKWRDESRPDIGDLQWFDFDPWIISGHQDLAAAYFKVLSENIGDSADRRATVRRLAKGAIDLGANQVIDAAAKVGWLIDHTGGAASNAGATIGKTAVKKAAEKWLSEPSLQKTYSQLIERLKQANRRFIVFVDDIDRLTNDEIRSLMQMVKTVGRLPNVTYVLSYDRQIVWSALGSFAATDGVRASYAEKIVQHEAEVPVPSRTGLMRMLELGMPDLPPPPSLGIRWMEMLQAGLQRWLRHPRDVVRLSNAMHFAWAALKDEVDAYDVLCMEAMRLFDRKVFDWVRDHRDLLLGEGLSYATSANEDEAAAAADALGDMLSDGAKADIIPILRLLFPTRTKLFGGRRGYSSEDWGEVVARRGIATKPGFTAYFSLAPSPEAVPKALIEEAAKPGTTRARHVDLIDAALELKAQRGASMVGEYFQEVVHRLRHMGEAEQVALLQALVDRSVAVFFANREAGIFGPASAHHVLVGEVLQRLGPARSADVLDDLFQTSDDVGALASMYVDLARSTGAIDNAGMTMRYYIAGDRLAPLGAALLPKIEAANAADTLTELPHYFDVARAWTHLGHLDAARTWLAREARRSATSLVRLSRGLLGSSHDGSKTRYGIYRDPDANFYDVDALADGCARFADDADLSDNDRERIDALAAGLDTLRRKQSSPDEDNDEF